MMNRKLFGLTILAALTTLTGCANFAPDFLRPAAPIPQTWPDSAGKVVDGKPLAEIDWQDFFADARLKQLVELALANNRDLRIAALNIERARAQYGISDAQRFPAINASGAKSMQRLADSQSPTGEAMETHAYSVGLGFAGYELDFFGRVRNLSEQALEQYLASTDARRSAQISLVAEVANIWLALAADQERLRLAGDTLTSQQSSLDLSQRTFDAGVSTALDLNQARILVESARVDIARYTAAVAQDRNALALVVGTQPPAELLPDTLTEVTTALTDIPAGVPSETLLQRPDIVAAERQLRAANASIGAARAAFYPRISLTASGGFASGRLGDLFDGGSGVWSFMPQIMLPIFNAGANQANLDVALADQKIRIAQYEKAIQSAFREAADALAVRATIDAQFSAQQALVAAAGETNRLSDLRFRTGVDSYLPVLDSQRGYYGAQQGLIAIKQARQSNVVNLYKVFGGGWKAEKQAAEAPAATTP